MITPLAESVVTQAIGRGVTVDAENLVAVLGLEGVHLEQHAGPSSDRDHGVAQPADALHVGFDDVARPHPLLRSAPGTDALGRARRDDVARLERDPGGNVGDQLRYLEQHVTCVGALLLDAVDRQPEVQSVRIRNLIGGHDARAERRIGVLPLGVDPLAGAAVVAGAHVDHHAVAEHEADARRLPTHAARCGR